MSDYTDKENMQAVIQEACAPCDVATDYHPTDPVCVLCKRRFLCAIVAANGTPDQVEMALALLKRVEAGDAVVVEKRFGGYPEINFMPGLGYTAGRTQEDGEYKQAVASSYEGVVSAWNGRAGG